MLGREGANILLHQPGKDVETGGEYGEGRFIFQQMAALKSFDGRYPVIGSWLIGHEEGNVAGGSHSFSRRALPGLDARGLRDVDARAGGELAERPAARQPLLAHLPAEVRYGIPAAVYGHSGYVDTSLPYLSLPAAHWSHACCRMGSALPANRSHGSKRQRDVPAPEQDKAMDEYTSVSQLDDFEVIAERVRVTEAIAASWTSSQRALVSER